MRDGDRTPADQLAENHHRLGIPVGGHNVLRGAIAVNVNNAAAINGLELERAVLRDGMELRGMRVRLSQSVPSNNQSIIRQTARNSHQLDLR